MTKDALLEAAQEEVRSGKRGSKNTEDAVPLCDDAAMDEDAEEEAAELDPEAAMEEGPETGEDIS